MRNLILVFVCTVAMLLPAVAPAVSQERVYTGPKTVFDQISTSLSTDAQASEPNAVDKWAVVIGIADYQGSGNDLLYPDDDANDMYNYLRGKGFPSANIKLLLNKKATATNIISAIDWMNSKETKATSECVFFYSGHGTTYDGYNDGDSEYTDEAIVSSNLYMILDGQLKQKFQTFASQKILFVFDSCFSGGMDDLSGAGRVVDMACSETQYSWDGDVPMKNGVFTYYYMQGLSANNAAEPAFAYAAPLAQDAVMEMYGEPMNPQQTDGYTGNWQI